MRIFVTRQKARTHMLAAVSHRQHLFIFMRLLFEGAHTNSMLYVDYDIQHFVIIIIRRIHNYMVQAWNYNNYSGAIQISFVILS